MPAWAVARLAVLIVLFAACDGDGDGGGGGADAAVADTGAPRPSISSGDQAAVREVADAFAEGLAQLQADGREALSPGGDLAAFYESFATATRDAADGYASLTLPGEVEAVRTRLVELLSEQVGVLEEISAGATAGENESLTPQLERLTELMGDVATVNAELLRSMEVDATKVGA